MTISNEDKNYIPLGSRQLKTLLCSKDEHALLAQKLLRLKLKANASRVSETLLSV